MDISFELYRVFYNVAKTLSFSKAAEQLFVSQSAVSQSIRQLEKKLECLLFVRNTKKVSLTADGLMLFEHLEQAFAFIYRAEKNLEMRKDPYVGELRIASTDTLCKYHLLPKIKSLSSKYPKMKFNIINGTSPACMGLLEMSAVDLAIVNISSDMDTKKYVIERSYAFKDVFVANQDVIHMKKRETTLEELSCYPLIMLDDKTVSRKFFNSLFQARGISVTPDIEVQSVDLLIEMAKAGLGVAFIPDYCVYANKDLFVFNVKRLPAREYGLITIKQMPLTPLGKVFLSIF